MQNQQHCPVLSSFISSFIRAATDDDSNSFFCPINSQKPKDYSFTIINGKKQKTSYLGSWIQQVWSTNQSTDQLLQLWHNADILVSMYMLPGMCNVLYGDYTAEKYPLNYLLCNYLIPYEVYVVIALLSFYTIQFIV